MALFSETDEKAWKDKYEAFRARGRGKFVVFSFFTLLSGVSLSPSFPIFLPCFQSTNLSVPCQ